MKKIALPILMLLMLSCSTKTTDLIIVSDSDIELDKVNEVTITRVQKGNNQTNDSGAEYLNYSLYLTDNEKDVPLKIAKGKTNANCKSNAINIQNGSELKNTFNRNILFKKEEKGIFVYIDCISEVYQFSYENEQNAKVKLIIEDKIYPKVKDSIVFNLKI